MSDKIVYKYNGIGFIGLLQLSFIVLRLCNIIDWHWGWVLAPIWMSIVLVIVIVIIAVIVNVIKECKNV